MRLAVFTNQFPGPVSTFFARDMRGLIDAGIEIDVFPIYPYDATLWRYVPDILNEKVLPRDRVHHMTLAQSLRNASLFPSARLARFLRDTFSIANSAIKFGVESFAKSAYVFPKSWAWAQTDIGNYDHVLAYWGNYTASCAYVFHRIAKPQVPFSLFLHAGMDLYRNPVYMQQKLLYADNILTCSEFNRDFIRDNFRTIWPRISHKIFVHPHGLDITEFSFQPNSRPARKIIAVGRLEHRKGFDYLLRATHELGCRGVDVQVILVGDGKATDSLKALAKDLQIQNRVIFSGWLTNAEVRKEMQSATVLAHPSAGLGDGVPNVIKEAMAVGTPVIASNVAGISELLENGKSGILVTPKDVKGLADAIELLLAAPDMQRDLSVSARKRVEQKFELWQNGKRLANLICSTTRHGMQQVTSSAR